MILCGLAHAALHEVMREGRKNYLVKEKKSLREPKRSGVIKAGSFPRKVAVLRTIRR